MADAITYADLRFVKVPLKNSISNHLGQGKSCLLPSLAHTPTTDLIPDSYFGPFLFQTVRPTRMENSPTRMCKCLQSQEGHQAWLPLR